MTRLWGSMTSCRPVVNRPLAPGQRTSQTGHNARFFHFLLLKEKELRGLKPRMHARKFCCWSWYYAPHSSLQRATTWWGGPPGPRPTPWSACSDASTPPFACGYAACWTWWGRLFRLPAIALLCASIAPAQMAVSGSMPTTILDTAPAAGSITALNGATAVALVGQSGAGVVLTGTWTATLTPELSFDGGATWVATSFYQPNLGQIVPTIASNGSYTILGSGGASNARVRASAFTSGTITASLRASASRPVILINAGSDGTNIHSLLTDTSGRLVLAGSSGTNITTATTTTVKGSAGVLRRLMIGTAVASATVKLFNVASGSCSGTPGSGASGVITLPSTVANPVSLELNQTFSAGICVVTSGATNLTVIFD
jgi:hypothetical protein